MASCGFMSSYVPDYFIAWHSCFREYCQHWGCQAVTRESSLCAKLSLFGEIYALSEVFSNSIVQFYKRKDFKDEDLLVGLANLAHLINFPTSSKEQCTATSLSFSMGTIRFSAR